MSTPPGNTWEPEPLDPAAAGPSPYGAPGGPSPSTAPGTTVPPAPGYAALYSAAPGYPAPGPGHPAMPFPGTPAGPMPPNHLVLAIVAIVLFWVPGLVALVYALQVESRWRAGDAVGAWQASESARKWGRWTVVITLALTAAWLVLVLVMSVLAS